MDFKNVLIVDDSSTSRMIIKRCFKIAGFNEQNYVEAEDAHKAMDLLRNTSIDLILTDLKMPKMDGISFIKKIKIKNTTSTIPIIVISSMGNNILEEQLLNMGVSAIIKKPLSPEKVHDTMAGLS